MNFASYEFWKLLIICFISSRLVLALVHRYQPRVEVHASKLCLLTTALTLLAAESTLTLAAFLWVVILGWICVCLQSFRCIKWVKNAVMLLLLAAQLAPLFYFKYWDFIFNGILRLDVRVPSVLIPMGLSFYTFQTIGFWIDNLRQPQPRPTFLDYLNFSSFFPQIVAGPIEKRDVLLPQINSLTFKAHLANVNTALQWMTLGLGYKLIIADNLGVYQDKFNVDSINPFQIWLDIFVFSIRIYFDFAGYSFIAVGLGLLFGVHLTLNFKCPYWSTSLREYWRCWHVTLGSWLRDYIYLPLGGNKNGMWKRNTLIVFLVSGLWHGAGWGYLIWGFMHGVGMLLCGKEQDRKLPWFTRWITTFTFVTVSRLFFMETNNRILLEKTISFFNPMQYNLQQFHTFSTVFDGPLHALGVGMIMALAILALLAEGYGILKKKEPYHYCKHPVATIVIAFMIVLLSPMEQSKFIYFNF